MSYLDDQVSTSVDVDIDVVLLAGTGDRTKNKDSDDKNIRKLPREHFFPNSKFFASQLKTTHDGRSILE